MNKKLYLLIFAQLLIFIFSPSFALADEYSEKLSDYDLSSFELLDEATRDFLQELGLDNFDYEGITQIRFSAVITHIVNVVISRTEAPLRAGMVLISFILISSFYCSISSQLTNDSYGDIFNVSVNMIVAVYVVNKLFNCISLSVATIRLCADFTYAFFPAFCIIVATSGGAVTSFSVNTSLLVLSQLLNIASGLVFVPMTNCFMTMGICTSVNNELNLSSLVSSIKNVIIKLISTLSAIFVSILSVKTAVASRADALGLRSIRFAINSVVPVIGGSISEGLLSIQSYSSLIKTSVGIIGIIAVFSVFLPAIAEVTIWRVVLSCAGICTQVFNESSCKDTLQVFKDVLLIINVIMILSMVTTIISIGILIAAKTGV